MFIITGGGTGIGRALAHALAMREQQVLVVGRREDALRETSSFSPQITYLCADVSTPEGCELIRAHVEKGPRLAGLVHNAGIIEPIVPIETLNETAWRQTLATNLDAPLFLTQMLYPQLTQGRVLHIGSGAAYFPIAGWTAYCVSKAALAMLTRCWALESKDVAFASVMPGIIDTPMQAVIRDASHMDPAKKGFFERLYHDQELLTTDTVAAFLTWLLLDIEKDVYVSKEWDIYDGSHHHEWLTLPHCVPVWEEHT